MAEIKETAYGGAAITLSSGLEIHFPGINPAGRGPIIEDVRNLVTALFAAVKDLDDRLAKLEKKK
jgi:hypothetical protein